ncbi:MAG: hypothetical protein ACJ73N_05605 [Bryobacteraceae bacterium]
MRKKIQQIIEADSEKERAAFRVCEYLEEELDLDGNGWFDDDPGMKYWLSLANEKKERK